MTSFNTVALAVLEIWVFKVQKTGYFLGKFSPPKVGTKSLILEFSKLVLTFIL